MLVRRFKKKREREEEKKRKILNWILERGEKKEEKRKEHSELKKRNLPKKEVNIGKGGKKYKQKHSRKYYLKLCVVSFILHVFM